MARRSRALPCSYPLRPISLFPTALLYHLFVTPSLNSLAFVVACAWERIGQLASSSLVENRRELTETRVSPRILPFPGSFGFRLAIRALFHFHRRRTDVVCTPHAYARGFPTTEPLRHARYVFLSRVSQLIVVLFFEFRRASQIESTVDQRRDGLDKIERPLRHDWSPTNSLTNK